MDIMDIEAHASEIGFTACREFDPALLVPEERIREYCRENKCGSYGKNYTCPPHVGTLEELAERLKEYRNGLLLQYAKEIDAKNNLKRVLRTKNDFHRMILRMEADLRQHGIERMWGMTGGNCGLCRTCKVNKNKPCKHPDESRVSLEAIGIDVMALLEKIGLDGEFRSDRIIWTGCILYQPALFVPIFQS